MNRDATIPKGDVTEPPKAQSLDHRLPLSKSVTTESKLCDFGILTPYIKERIGRVELVRRWKLSGGP